MALASTLPSMKSAKVPASSVNLSNLAATIFASSVRPNSFCASPCAALSTPSVAALAISVGCTSRVTA